MLPHLFLFARAHARFPGPGLGHFPFLVRFLFPCLFLSR